MAQSLADLAGLPQELAEMLAQVGVIAAAGEDAEERDKQYASLERMLEAAATQNDVAAAVAPQPPPRRRQLVSACSAARLADIRLVCCDMDGTWLGPDHAPTPGGRKALRLAESAAAGEMTWVFATGRCPASAAGVAQIEGFDKRPGTVSYTHLTLPTT